VISFKTPPEINLKKRIYFRRKSRVKQTFPGMGQLSVTTFNWYSVKQGKMKGPFLKMRDSLWGIIVPIVFTGLIFSCAEGIRLLPFPPPETNGAGDVDSHTGKFEHLSYVRCLDSGRTSLAFESRPSPVKHLSGNWGQTPADLLNSTCGSREAVFNLNRIRLHSAPARILPETRGPPVFFTT
jgi:hypothetical protein